MRLEAFAFKTNLTELKRTCTFAVSNDSSQALLNQSFYRGVVPRGKLSSFFEN